MRMHERIDLSRPRMGYCFRVGVCEVYQLGEISSPRYQSGTI